VCKAGALELGQQTWGGDLARPRTVERVSAAPLGWPVLARGAHAYENERVRSRPSRCTRECAWVHENAGARVTACVHRRECALAPAARPVRWTGAAAHGKTTRDQPKAERHRRVGEGSGTCKNAS
jgi:hypothetical protein